VTQNFDDGERAADARLAYSSRETPRGCIDRFNGILAMLAQRYGAPAAVPAVRREPGGDGVTSSQAFQYVFANRAALRAELQLTTPGGDAGAQPAAAGAGGASGGCKINLHYLPPGWVADF
jgi:hypothetical protein